ncbi:site-specific DNA-methyltransferase [Salipiger sp. IMCC34102]|uniref:site-specific DNA-methyltransferase n=1 Tax=Salipiger sp. IMCC34102 TaxID=2510647 RepID=UPI0013E9D974|nr:site-specific DNA-methyltransferase [Salipiger sp. IMCC34102]
MTDVALPSQLEMIAPSELVAFERNSRTHSDEQVLQIAASIQEFGFTNPVLISDVGEIIAGHGRVLAAERIGLAEVPCLRLAHLSEEQRRAYVIADNKLAENAGWDRELLALELGELRDLGFGIDVIGFSQSELDLLFLDGDDIDEEGQTDDDAVPDAGDGYVSAEGDVWVLGDHLVMCGDSTSEAHFAELMGGELADMCWTDPPYNVNYEGSAGKIKNDHMAGDAFRQFLLDCFGLVASFIADGGSCYVAHADTEGRSFRAAFQDSGFKTSGCLVWIKPSLVLGRSDYQWQHEPILYGWKEGAAHRWFGGRKQTTVLNFEQPPFVVTADGAVEIDVGETTLRISGADLKVEELVGSVIRHDKPRKNGDHPTMKPVGLILRMLKNSSARGDIVLDPFGGSGSTLIAAQKCGRRARLMELDPRFADVIVRRWQEWTGLKAHLRSTGEGFDELSASRGQRLAVADG